MIDLSEARVDILRQIAQSVVDLFV